MLITRDLVLRNHLGMSLHLRGPERVALIGGNGSGKTTLIDTLVGAVPPLAGSVDLRVPFRLLPQRLQLLDDDETVLSEWRATPRPLIPTRCAPSWPGSC